MKSRIPSDREALIALSLVPGLGAGRIRNLVDWFGSPCAALSASGEQLRSVQGIGNVLAREICSLRPVEAVREQIRRAERVGASLVMKDDPGYPALLREIYDPPAFMWRRGAIRAEMTESVAVVGTRRPTRYGRRVTRSLVRSLVECGYVIVSGLAHGIDAEAHHAAIEAGGITVAVLGCGTDVVYPAANRGLFGAILKKGFVFSEFPMGSKPEATNFPRRNRTISGMCRGVVVVEAFQKGGGLITARMALEQNREVFAVPGQADSHASAGTNALIRDGAAKLVMSVDDVVQELPFFSDRRHTVTRLETRLPDLSEDEAIVIKALQSGPLHVDDITSIASMDISRSLAVLLSLEMKGYIEQGAGKVFYLSSRTEPLR